MFLFRYKETYEFLFIIVRIISNAETYHINDWRKMYKYIYEKNEQ